VDKGKPSCLIVDEIDGALGTEGTVRDAEKCNRVSERVSEGVSERRSE
jgi:hypothetical protein